MRKFEVGDVLIGKKVNPYYITNSTRQVRVIKVISGDQVLVVAVRKTPFTEGRFIVQERYFKLVKKGGR